jgi:hypothetical protein
MVRKITVLLVDDLDGKTADETVRFALDGVHYQIELSARHAKNLRATLQPWIAAARRVGRAQPQPKARRSMVDRRQSAAIRRWARRHGYQVAERGRIPREVIVAYRSAQLRRQRR